MREASYQQRLISIIEKRYPGCVVLKNDPNYIQGIPDLTIFYGNRWATLEVKCGEKEPHQPNQDYYVGVMNEMAFSSFIFPQNEEIVLGNLDLYFHRRLKDEL